MRSVARAAGLGHVHPHQLRHTLATQAINRGMRLEAIAAMLGHYACSLHMTMVYARIANRTVADEYAAAQAKVDALYEDDVPANLRQLKSEHRRMLGNGWCTRPAGTDCAFEAVCEGCGFFQTTIDLAPARRPNGTMPRPIVSRSARSSTSVWSPPSTTTLRRVDEPPETIGRAPPDRPITGISRVPLDGSPVY